MTTRLTAVGIGEVLWDELPTGRQLGGAVANAAYHARALGANGIIASQVGDDEAGREIIRRLQALGLDTGAVGIDPEHPTGSVDIRVDSKGQPAYTIHENVAWDFLGYSQCLEQLEKETDIVFFGSLASRHPVSRQTISRFLESLSSDCLRVLDINLRQSFYSKPVLKTLLERCDVLKLNDEELRVLAELFELNGDNWKRGMEELLIMFQLTTIALTSGSKGSVLYNGEEMDVCPPDNSRRIKDTVGAGDSFCATMALGLLKNIPLTEINQAANRVAAYVCSRDGATPEIPAELHPGFLSGKR